MSTLEEVTDLLASRPLVACIIVGIVKCKNFKPGNEFAKASKFLHVLNHLSRFFMLNILVNFWLHCNSGDV